MTMLNRTFGAGTYRFQYQGSEQDREITNGNNSNYTTEFRSLDVRLGRWLSPDPITHPSWSPYHSMYDNPIGVTDVMGLDGTRSPDSKPTQYDDNGNGVSEPNEGCDGTNESAGKSTETLFKGDNIGGIKYVQGDVSHYVQVEYNGKKYSFSDTPQPNSEGIGAGKYGKAPENTLDNLETWLEIAEKEKDGIPAFDDVFYSDDECWELVVDDVVMEYALILAGNQAGNAIQKGATTGSIYLVPGTSTKSGKPYVGRNNTPDPAKNRKSKDGRDRTKAKVIDNYDANDEELGSYLEQTHINKNGVPKKTLDNKRNEVSPARMKDLQKKYRGKVLPPSKNQQKQIKEKKKEDSDYLINHG